MHVQREPEPPSARAELQIPAGLEALILACLAKDPADRPQTADAVRARLDTVGLEQPWTAARARAWWDAHRPAADTAGD